MDQDQGVGMSSRHGFGRNSASRCSKETAVSRSTASRRLRLLLLPVCAFLFGAGVLGLSVFVSTERVAGQPPVPQDVTATKVEVAQARAGQDADAPADVVVSETHPVSFWMTMKLEYAKQMLEGLTSADFETLSNASKQMQVIGKLEAFVRSRNPEYAEQMRAFQLANRQLTRHAARNNVEGATLAFQQLTASCVACHTSLREPAAQSTP